MYPLLFLISIGSRIINTMGMVKNKVWFGSFFFTNHSFRFPLRRTLTHSVGCNRFSILVYDFIGLYRKFYKIRYLSLTLTLYCTFDTFTVFPSNIVLLYRRIAIVLSCDFRYFLSVFRFSDCVCSLFFSVLRSFGHYFSLFF